MLFDFSLADVPDRDVQAGTRGYLDPSSAEAVVPATTTTPSGTPPQSRCMRWRPANARCG
ncbi:hypothetical protein NKH18_21600 [Streptomyces sp. M10(2022)]